MDRSDEQDAVTNTPSESQLLALAQKNHMQLISLAQKIESLSQVVSLMHETTTKNTYLLHPHVNDSNLLRVQASTGEATVNWIQFLFALLFAAAAGWVCIAAFLALLKKVGLFPFVVYRLLLGLLLLWLVR